MTQDEKDQLAVIDALREAELEAMKKDVKASYELDEYFNRKLFQLFTGKDDKDDEA